MARISVKKHTQRIRMAKGFLERGFYDWEIKLLISEREGVSKRTVERYLFKARQLMRKDMERTADELRTDAIAFYRSVIQDMHVSPKDRIKAQERIDKLLGLEKPTVIHQRMEGSITHNHRTIVDAVKDDSEARDLLLKLSRRMTMQ